MRCCLCLGAPGSDPEPLSSLGLPPSALDPVFSSPTLDHDYHVRAVDYGAGVLCADCATCAGRLREAWEELEAAREECRRRRNVGSWIDEGERKN